MNRFDLIELPDDLPSLDGVLLRRAPPPPPPPREPSVADLIAAAQARREQGPWVPGCGGTEVPFRTRTGRRLLYCWQPATGRHAYLDCETDMVLSLDESRRALGDM